jgi:hypothetical protein
LCGGIRALLGQILADTGAAGLCLHQNLMGSHLNVEAEHDHLKASDNRSRNQGDAERKAFGLGGECDAANDDNEQTNAGMRDQSIGHSVGEARKADQFRLVRIHASCWHAMVRFSRGPACRANGQFRLEGLCATVGACRGEVRRRLRHRGPTVPHDNALFLDLPGHRLPR